MADVALMTLSIDEGEDGQFWISIEGQPEMGRHGPFESELEAAENAAAFINEVLAAVTRANLGI